MPTVTNAGLSRYVPRLGWCNVVVSPLPWEEILRQFRLHECGTKVYKKPGRRASHSSAVNYTAFSNLCNAPAPTHVPVQFAVVLRWCLQNNIGMFARINTTAVLDVLWAAYYVKRAVAISKRDKNKKIGMLHSMFKPYQGGAANYSVKLTEKEISAVCSALVTREVKIFYVNEGVIKDISDMSAALNSDDEIASNWGGMLSVADRAGKIVSSVVNRYMDK